MFSKRLKELRKAAHLTQTQLAEKLGLAKSTISMYENGNRVPQFEDMEAIADFFNVSLNYFSSLDNSYGLDPIPQTYNVRRLGIISCGKPIDSEENFDGWDEVPMSIRADYSLIAEGDSMTGARINDGDIVYIRQQPTVENGQIAAVLVDGSEKLLKRFYRNEDSVILQAENPAYAPLVFSKEEINRISIIGLAVGFTSVLR